MVNEMGLGRNGGCAIVVSPDDLASWCRDGFWISPIILGIEELDELKVHLAELLAGHYDRGMRPLVDPYSRADDPLAIQNIDNAHWADSAIRTLALNRTIGSIAAQLLDASTIRLWAMQALAKPPGGASQSNVGWHQDMSYWHCARPAELLTAWVPLHDVDESNGCLRFVPGSHAWGPASRSFFFEPPSDGQFEQMVDKRRDFRIAKSKMAAGQVSFHHCLTWHASGPNRTVHPRLAISIHLMSGVVRYHAGSDCDDHINVRLLKGKDGYPFAGKYFPVVFSS